MMARNTWHNYLIQLLLTLCFVKDTCSSSPWYESLPAVAMDYKVHLAAGKEDCYYQYVQAGATFYASYQVLKGGDGMCGFAVRHPSGQVVHPYEWRPSGEYTDHSSTGGYYSICIDNQFSRFAEKLVNIYISVIRYDQWEKFSKEIQELDMNIQNFTSSIQHVERNINEILQLQYHSRARESRDYNLLTDNNAYVLRWSLAQVIAVAATGTLQVYFLRKLFEVNDGSSKCRI